MNVTYDITPGGVGVTDVRSVVQHSDVVIIEVYVDLTYPAVESFTAFTTDGVLTMGLIAFSDRLRLTSVDVKTTWINFTLPSELIDDSTCDVVSASFPGSDGVLRVVVYRRPRLVESKKGDIAA